MCDSIDKEAEAVTMPNVVLTDDEAAVLRIVLSLIVIRNRTGEVGVLHGLERFVSTNACLKKADRNRLDSAAQKIGLTGVSVTSK